MKSLEYYKQLNTLESTILLDLSKILKDNNINKLVLKGEEQFYLDNVSHTHLIAINQIKDFIFIDCFSIIDGWLTYSLDNPILNLRDHINILKAVENKLDQFK